MPEPAKPYDPTKTVEKLNYTHKACVDLVLAHPEMSQGQLSAVFGYTQGWLSRVMASDAFQEYLAQRRAELVDPYLMASLEERIKGVAMQAVDTLSKKLEANPTGEFALKCLELSTRALGYGAKPTGGVTVNQQFVVHAPPKSANSTEWLEAHRPALIELPALPAEAA